MPVNIIEDFFRACKPPIEYVRAQWIDLSGMLHARFIPAARCVKIAEGTDAMRFTQNSMDTAVAIAPSNESINDYFETWELVPDWTSLRVCGYRANHATVMCFVDQLGAPERFDKCPRTCLVNAINALQDSGQVVPTMGFEIEFVLLDSNEEPIKPLDRLNGYSRTAGLRTETLDLVEAIIAALKRSSIDIHVFHVETQDQLEISLCPEAGIRAVDSLIIAQETVHTLCLQRGLQASMAPKIGDGITNGLHMHLSLSKVEPERFESVIAGLLTHMPALCAFGMANFDSYVRLEGPGSGSYIGYGTDSRGLPVRKINGTHLELRVLDSTANVFLFAAVALFLSLRGLRDAAPLTWKDCNKFTALLSEEARESYGLIPMPGSLKDALSALRKDETVRLFLGKELTEWYLWVKDQDVASFSKMTEQQRLKRFKTYF